MNDTKLISSRNARAELGEVSEMTFWRWVKAGILPAPIKINKRNYWPESAIDRVKMGAPRAGA